MIIFALTWDWFWLNWPNKCCETIWYICNDDHRADWSQGSGSHKDGWIFGIEEEETGEGKTELTQTNPNSTPLTADLIIDG